MTLRHLRCLLDPFYSAGPLLSAYLLSHFFFFYDVVVSSSFSQSGFSWLHPYNVSMFLCPCVSRKLVTIGGLIRFRLSTSGVRQGGGKTISCAVLCTCIRRAIRLSDQVSACQCRRGFHPWVGKILWRRKWQLTLVFLPGKFCWQRSLLTMGSQKVEHGHDLAANQQQCLPVLLWPFGAYLVYQIFLTQHC